jgi:hypothetical protein
MVEFNLWIESLIFGSIFSVIVIIPCVLVTILGKKMIYELGQYPTKTPVIQMSILFQLIVVEILTFICLLGFYNFFSV